jgi:arabinose-5-phosphate isomerase
MHSMLNSNLFQVKPITAYDHVETAFTTMKHEADAIYVAAGRLNSDFSNAVKKVLRHKGKVIVTGIGKSGHVGQKIAATLCSTGTPAVFLHATEAAHGDLGVYSPGDPTLLISKSGATYELLRLIPMLRQFESPLIGILGNMNSALAQQVDYILDGTVHEEADPLHLTPTASTTVALALGDAFAAALMQAREFTELDFARYHPAGQLGRNLWLIVADVMQPSKQVAQVRASDSLRKVVIEMTSYPLGVACVVDLKDRLLGIITDGDLRRALSIHEDILTLRADAVMTPQPVTIETTATLKEAVDRMERRTSQYG